ncbi:MAG: thioredoxin family protein, partial [Paucibacter sp.]|nr:thioredoxin family protein [Roseateles sp.]
SRWADSLNERSQKLEGGRAAAVFAMGALSALLVSPCVTGVLASALLYLSKTHDVLLGGGALYALANGMSVPLLLIGLSAGTLLPKAGPWMDGVKHIFGMALLGLALWTVQPLLSDALLQALLGLLLVGISLALGLLRPWHASMGPKAWLRRALAMAAMFAGLMQWAGAAAGGTDVLRPLAGLKLVAAASAASPEAAQVGPSVASVPQEVLNFTPVHDVAELDHLLQTAGKPVMLDFYADWCKSCKEMERMTFSQPTVRQRLAGALLLKADVTANAPADRELLKRFGLFGPPGTIFFAPGGAELKDKRVIGFQDADDFLKSLAAAGI